MQILISRMTALHFARGYFETQSALNEVCLEPRVLESALRERLRLGHETFVGMHPANGRVIAIATLVKEQKYSHNAGIVYHLEDVAVHTDHQGMSCGRQLVEYVRNYALQRGYKIILKCTAENVGFYLKCGFKLQPEFCMKAANE